MERSIGGFSADTPLLPRSADLLAASSNRRRGSLGWPTAIWSSTA